MHESPDTPCAHGVNLLMTLIIGYRAATVCHLPACLSLRAQHSARVILQIDYTDLTKCVVSLVCFMLCRGQGYTRSVDVVSRVPGNFQSVSPLELMLRICCIILPSCHHRAGVAGFKPLKVSMDAAACVPGVTLLTFCCTAVRCSPT